MSNWDRIFQKIRKAKNKQGVSLAVTRAYPSTFVRPDGAGDLVLAIPGLYGGFGVLPDYFTDELLLEGEDREAMRAFLDLFNSRLVELLSGVWARYRLFIEDPLEGGTAQGKREMRMLSRLSGKLVEREEPLYLKGLRQHKLGLFRRAARTSDGLLELLGTFFPDLTIELEQFVVQYRSIPQKQLARLGTNTLIGAEGSFLAGRRIKDIGGGFRLFFRALDYESFMRLSPGGDWRKLLETLTNDYTKGRLDCLIRLELKASDVPSWKLESPGKPGRLLGRNMWLKSLPSRTAEVVDAGRLA